MLASYSDIMEELKGKQFNQQHVESAFLPDIEMSEPQDCQENHVRAAEIDREGLGHWEKLLFHSKLRLIGGSVQASTS